MAETFDTTISRELAKGDESFFIVDLQKITDRVERWRTHLAQVEPYYAVKANPDHRILKHLLHTFEKKGIRGGFDCASKNEIQKILALGVSRDRVIFTNPCKIPSHLSFTKEVGGVRYMTFDSESELLKILPTYPDTELLLRIKTDDSSSRCRFSCKFGAPSSCYESLLGKAAELHLKIVGVSFHVGSGCMSASSFSLALQETRKIFQMARRYGFSMDTVDIGGGFTGSNFEEMASTIQNDLLKFAPKTKVIAEPGRFFVEDSTTLVLTVIGKKIDTQKGRMTVRREYTLNDSVYCSLNNVIMDHFEVTMENLVPYPAGKWKADAILYSTTLFLYSCDSLDVLSKEISLPDLEVGDRLLLKDVGAYTVLFTPHVPDVSQLDLFNGFGRARSVYI